MKISSPTERAIKVMLWGMKSQLFWDGNKRTSMLAANKIMIENGCGIISVPNEKLQEFNERLSDFYTNGSLEQIAKFVYDECVDGLGLRTRERAVQQTQENRDIPPKTTTPKKHYRH